MPVPRHYTADELLRMPERSTRYELAKGELCVREPTGHWHSSLALAIATRIRAYATEHQLGVTSGADGGYLLAIDPDTVRAPDVGFVRQERVPRGATPAGFWFGTPDLAVEVLSLGNTRETVDQKAREYLDAGSRLVWIVDGAAGTVTVLRPGAAPKVLGMRDMIDGGSVLPGFQLRVSELLTLT